MEWHSSALEDVLRSLGASDDGLSGEEAQRRLAAYGQNSIAIKKEISPLSIFINQFKNMLVILLLLAAFVSLAISFLDPEHADILDALLIFAIVIANAIFGFVQEYKAEKSIEALTRMAAPKATVIRGGREIEIASEDVVPGDVLVLREGDKIAADARLIEAFSLFCDESSLTGESLPSLKKAGVSPSAAPLAERSNMVFMNAVVTRGRASAVVVETGLRTEIGKIAKEISEAPDKVTQFQIEIEDVGKKISVLTLGILVVIAATEFMMRSGDIVFIFIAAVALGVAAIPEGLPAVVTLALSIATNRMLKERALMRRLSTVQDLGSVDIICTDKTGTLTENVMTVTRIHLDGMSFEVTGKGHETDGEFIPLSGGRASEMEMLLRCAILCNDARLGEGGFRGDPTEIAVLIPAYKAGMDAEKIRREMKRVGEVSFSAERKLMSTANSDGKKTCSFVKGAPEMLLPRCDRILSRGKVRKLTKKDRDDIEGHNNQMAAGALRVLGFAYKESPKTHEEEDMESGLIFLGLMGMIDPPRDGVKKAVDDCRSAGIRVIMVTGDNRYTAEAIGKELGFRARTMSGDELDSLSEKEFSQAIEKIDIYARTSPKHKVMLLNALKRNDHIVCMTGDGVNDAAAIKNSDVGIAMGIRGTEVTKQASDIIILDDNFITIRNAIREGRGAFDNIRKFVTLLIGANTSEVLAVFLATISPLGLPPKIAIQLLWINLLTDGLPALALGAGAPAKGVMERKPRPKSERIINGAVLYFVAWMGVVEALAVLATYSYFHLFSEPLKAHTMFFTSFVIFEMISVYLVRWRFRTPFLSNKWVHLAICLSLALQLLLLYTEAASWFGVVPLNLADWAAIAVVGLAFISVMALAMRLEGSIIGTLGRLLAKKRQVKNH